jgi:zinc transport system permease protein
MIIRSNWCGITTTLEAFLTLLSAGFIQRAFVIGLIIAVLSSILSVFVVLKRVSLIGDGLAHTAFGGLALGYYLSSLGAFSGALGGYLDVFPIWVAAVVVVLGSVGITKAIRSAKVAGDAAVALFLQLGLAFGIVLLSLSRGFGINLESLLFGSILVVTSNQIILAMSILIITFVLIFLFFKELVYTTFDEVQARAAGVETPFFDYLISVLAGIVVIASIPIVGVLLVSALLVLPAVTSVQISRSFKQTMILSPMFGIISVIIGLPLSIILDTASGATIVLTGLGIFLVVLGAKRLTKASVKSASS